MRAALLALMLCVGALANAGQDTASGEPFFQAALLDLSARPVPMERFRGRPALVSFWARWCVPCRDEFPELQRQNDLHRKDGLLVVGVALDDHTDAVKDFAHAYEIGYLVLVAGQGDTALLRSLGNARAGLPFTLAIDRRGQIVGRRLGVSKRSDLDAFVAEALK
jgi:thiol-disulfide isomerase/thioredoxin